MLVKKAPEEFDVSEKLSIFLAGSIEMGRAEDWQAKTTEKFSAYDVLILNPRRDNWDSSWEQSIEDKNFKEQVNWELEAQERCDIIIMYFCPDTRSPISLHELGMFATTGKLRVCCPKGFWKKGNVDVTCDRYKIPLYEDLDLMTDTVIEEVYARLQLKHEK